jgi:hypothetical protein
VLTIAQVQLEYLDATVLLRGVGEVRTVVGRAPACWQVWRGMQYKEECFYNWAWGVCSHWKQTNDSSQHPSISRMDLANHCAASPELSLLNTRAVPRPCSIARNQGISREFRRRWKGMFLAVAICCRMEGLRETTKTLSGQSAPKLNLDPLETRTTWSIHPLPNTPSWRSPNRNNFTFYIG